MKFQKTSCIPTNQISGVNSLLFSWSVSKREPGQIGIIFICTMWKDEETFTAAGRNIYTLLTNFQTLMLEVHWFLNLSQTFPNLWLSYKHRFFVEKWDLSEDLAGTMVIPRFPFHGCTSTFVKCRKNAMNILKTLWSSGIPRKLT